MPPELLLQELLLSSSTISQPSLQSDAKRVLIVILNWNSPEETLSAVNSVLQMDYPNYRLLIIDNGSTDHSTEALAQIEDSRVKLIRLPENLGFTGGCNIGFDEALKESVDYVWLLNSDSVTEATTLSSLVRTAEKDSRIGLVSPLIASLQRPSIYIYAGGYFDAQIPICRSTRDPQVAVRWADERKRSVLLLGTALLVRVDLIRKIGKLDAKFFAYWEDTDFSMRSNEAGFLNVVDMSATIYHSEKFPTDSPQNIRPHFWYYVARNEIRFWKKHAGCFSRLRPLWWAYKLQHIHLKLVQDAEASQQAIYAGIWDGWRNKTGSYSSNNRMPRLVMRVLKILNGIQR